LKVSSVTSWSLPVTGIGLLGLRLVAQYFIKYSEVREVRKRLPERSPPIA
jgi:hypothetical protein